MARFFKWFFGLSGGAVVFLSQTPPDEAISSLGKWAKIVGVDKPPSWLITQSADVIGLWVGIGFIVAGCLLWAYPNFKNKVLIFVKSIRQKTNEDNKNLDIYFESDSMQIYKLAYLSLGKEPEIGKIIYPKVLRRNETLKDMIKSGDLKASLNGDNIDGYASVKLHDFIEYAEHSNIQDFRDLASRWEKYHQTDNKEVNESSFVRMSDVARKIYDKHKKCGNGYHLEFVDYIESHDSPDDNILNCIAEAIAHYVYLYGENIYGAELLKIDTSNMHFGGENRSHYFKCNGDWITKKSKKPYDKIGKREWENVQIKKSDEEKAITSIIDHTV